MTGAVASSRELVFIRGVIIWAVHCRHAGLVTNVTSGSLERAVPTPMLRISASETSSWWRWTISVGDPLGRKLLLDYLHQQSPELLQLGFVEPKFRSRIPSRVGLRRNFSDCTRIWLVVCMPVWFAAALGPHGRQIFIFLFQIRLSIWFGRVIIISSGDRRSCLI